jgi:hypothetical protein
LKAGSPRNASQPPLIKSLLESDIFETDSRSLFTASAYTAVLVETWLERVDLDDPVHAAEGSFRACKLTHRRFRRGPALASMRVTREQGEECDGPV